MIRKLKNNARRALAEAMETRTLFAALTPISFATNVSFVAGSAPDALVAADFQPDGHLDLAVADRTSNKVDLFFGNGAGLFAAGPQLPVSSPPLSIITGDFNGDGRTDIAVGLSPATGQTTANIDVFLNAGSGNFGLGQISPVETNGIAGEPVALAAGDFNKDGKLDLAVTAFNSNCIAIYSGLGTGVFATPTLVPLDAFPTAVTAADFNNDGNTDLAATTTTVNVALGNTNDGSAVNHVDVLQNDGHGNFSAAGAISVSSAGTVAGITAANLTSTGTSSLLVASTDNTVTVIANNGGNFGISAVAMVAGGTRSVAAGDFNLDGHTDFVSANGQTYNGSNSVTVVPGLGGGTLSASQSPGTGVDPVAVAAADFNNDGKPDIATADAGDGTVSILLNNTTIAAVSTSIKLTSDNLSAPAGNTVTLTATVTGSSVSPIPGESIPTGTVNFYDGSTLLGSATLVSGTDQAQYQTTALTVGNHALRATYAGDSAYSGSTSPRITQVITPTADQGPDLVGKLVSSTLPSTVAPGETGVIRVQITNQGNTPATSSIINNAYLSLDSTVDAGSVPLRLRGALAHTRVHLQPGQSMTVSGTITIPQDAPLASYSLLVALDSTNSLLESVSTNDTVVSPTPYDVEDVFGTVAGRTGVVLNVSDNNGTPAKFRLIGPGSGAINIGDNGVQIVLTGTTPASTLNVTAIHGTAFVANDLTGDGSIGSIRGAKLAVTNQIRLAGGATSITLASSGAISAAWIGMLRIANGFSGGLILNGDGAPAGVALKSANIGGMTSGIWNVSGNIGRVSLISTPSSANGWDLSDTGALQSLSVATTFYGNVLADRIGSMQIRGDLYGGTIAANSGFNSLFVTGNLVDAKVLAAISSTGTIGNLRVSGSVTNSLIGAGIGDGSGTPIVVNGNGTLRAVAISGSVDSLSKFLAANLPAKARLDNSAVVPAVDSHFHV